MVGLGSNYSDFTHHLNSWWTVKGGVRLPSTIELRKYNGSTFITTAMVSDLTDGDMTESHAPTITLFDDKIFCFYKDLDNASYSYLKFDGEGRAISRSVRDEITECRSTPMPFISGGKLYLAFYTNYEEMGFCIWDPAASKFNLLADVYVQLDHKVAEAMNSKNFQVPAVASIGNKIYIFGTYIGASNPVRGYSSPDAGLVAGAAWTGFDISGISAPADRNMCAGAYKGGLLLAYRGVDQLLYMVRSSDMTTWEHPVRLGSGLSEHALGSDTGPAICVATDRDTLQLVYVISGVTATSTIAQSPDQEYIVGKNSKGFTPALAVSSTDEVYMVLRTAV